MISCSQGCWVSMPSWAWVVTSLLGDVLLIYASFNALMGLSCYQNQTLRHATLDSFNALSGLYLISTLKRMKSFVMLFECQCPLGLIPHFYSRFTANLFIFYGCQCPLGLIPHFYVPLQKPRFYAVSRACFCRYLSEYSDNSRFSCMLTFWTYLMRCTYPWHWIKYSTNYNRCHPIFSLSW